MNQFDLQRVENRYYIANSGVNQTELYGGQTTLN